MDKGVYFQLAGKSYHLHDSVFQAVVVSLILMVLGMVIRAKIKKADYKKKPKGLLLIMEMFYNSMETLVEQTMGKGQKRFVPYMGTLLLFLVCANLWGLLGFTPPTSDYNVTVALATITFILIHFWGIRSKGMGGYVKGYFEPMPLFFPINVIGELANPVSLSFRLFGNILSGSIIMSLVHFALGKISMMLVPLSAVLHLYFDVFSGLLQAFVFVMLSMAYIGQAFPEN
ncbi:MAG: F0F1 ATP synthase subunit A [Tissierellia bacterium]|nr:F0F1 ATP synthase subunit A [Tissierellia bacterium]